MLKFSYIWHLQYQMAMLYQIDGWLFSTLFKKSEYNFCFQTRHGKFFFDPTRHGKWASESSDCQIQTTITTYEASWKMIFWLVMHKVHYKINFLIASNKRYQLLERISFSPKKKKKKKTWKRIRKSCKLQPQCYAM